MEWQVAKRVQQGGDLQKCVQQTVRGISIEGKKRLEWQDARRSPAGRRVAKARAAGFEGVYTSIEGKKRLEWQDARRKVKVTKERTDVRD